ncbi:MULTISPECIES: hypothetical protein [unclassified Bartonella]|uniref:hypothetical protein n=1 Tax=unclassified Bartonella TaxID=2645622 RepID=UPI0035D0335A
MKIAVRAAIIVRIRWNVYVPITTNRLQTDHISDMLRVKKALLNNTEFTSAMYGSNEGGGIQGKKAPSPKHSGGYKNTANIRMISHIGCEDGCGYVWQFLAGTFPMQITNRGQARLEMRWLSGGGGWSHGVDSGCFARSTVSSSRGNEQLCARGCSHSRDL